MVRPALRQGMTVDGFLIGEAVHEGGMSILWRVTRSDVQMPLIMKVPRLQEGEESTAIVGFEMEQLILPRLSGIHVPKFIAAGDFAVQPYIVMEEIVGRSLLPLVDSLPLPCEEVAAIGAKVATALHDIHRQHVIHLDVKPSNVVIRDTGEAALIDFGLAHHDQLPDLLDEEFRVPWGTPPYMAPEQVLGVRWEARSDIFSLGVLLYFFSTGVRPFGDPRGKRRMHRRLWRDPVPPRRRRTDMPPWLQEIILRCLEVAPGQRHPTAAQLAFDLLHPDQVKLTARSERLRQDSWSTALRRRFAVYSARPVRRQDIAAQISRGPIVAIAVDLEGTSEVLAEALRVTVRRILETLPAARLACLNVLKQHRVALDQTLDAEGKHKHLERLVQLRHWAQPLAMAEGRITFHVLEATDTAAAILDYTRTNHVEHVVLGARTNSLMRDILGSVSGAVAAKAPCTVTVVRPPRTS